VGKGQERASGESLRIPACNLQVAPERKRSNMADDGYKKASDGLLENYLSLGVSAETIVRRLKKTAKSESRTKLVQELRNLDKKRLEILDQMDGLAKST
jgi:hypothetical protein